MAIIDYDDDVHRDTNVLEPNVYTGAGQGCGTVWFDSVLQARRIITKLGRIPTGQDSGLCEQCSCHYSFGSPEHKKYPEYACREYKKSIAQIKEGK